MKTEEPIIHPDFRFNGIHYDLNALKDVAYSLIKEGEPFEQRIGDFMMDWISDDDTVLVTTSGATGPPKRLFLKKEHMRNSAKATGALLGLQEGDSALLCLPAEYVAGKMMLARAMVLGLDLDYAEPASDPLWSTLDSYDFSAMVPMQLQRSLKKLDRFGTLLVGGAPVSDELRKALQDSKTRIFETYGMTETCTHVALKALNPAASKLQGTSDTSFKAMPGVTFSIDERGCLVVTAPDYTDYPITTNDMVELLNEGEFVWLGRYDNLVNSGGVKLIPESIEAKVKTVFDGTFILGGIPDERLGQSLVMVVEAKEVPGDLKERLENLKPLGKYEVPKRIFALEEFPRTQNGKIKRKQVLKQFYSGNTAG